MITRGVILEPISMARSHPDKWSRNFHLLAVMEFIRMILGRLL